MADQRQEHFPESPGHMILYDYYKPTLYEGNYRIESKQTITAAGQAVTIYNYDGSTVPPIEPGADPTPPPQAARVHQNFTIVAPQFSIDPKLVNSCYPPPGHADEGRVLPHIVFNDPHLPWERPPFPPAAQAHFAQTVWPPWFALVVFDPEELRISQAEAAKLGVANTKLSEYSGSYSTTVGHYLGGVTSKPDWKTGYRHRGDYLKHVLTQSTEPVEVIFPTRGVIIDTLGNPAKFKYLCHTRKLDTHGLPDAANLEKGLYSICVSHRSGPILTPDRNNPPAPRPQIVHLVSIECMVDEQGNFVPPERTSSTDRVGLVSLFSWSYLATPPSPNNTISIMRDLGVRKQPLMPPMPLLESIKESARTATDVKKRQAAERLHARLSQGYSIVRWRTSTGEETGAFNRGPFTPNQMPQTPALANDWPDSSNTGKEFQILDKSTGLMDLTYSSAWQLGKLLAIGDTGFSSALLRFRSVLHRNVTSETRIMRSNLTSAQRILSGATTTLSNVNSTTSSARVPTRISLPVGVAAGDLPSADTEALFRNLILREAASLAGISDDVQAKLFTNPDFLFIQNWMDNKLLMSGIPYHYLITDPSHLSSTADPKAPPIRGNVELPTEGMRFFYIDNSWMDCFFDGALSTANHLDPIYDSIRKAIKMMYNKYLADSARPVPVYGFFLRSSIVKAIPDLRVRVTFRVPNGTGGWREDASKDPNRNPIIRLTRVDDHTILALLKCLPEDIHSIILGTPAHQQRFVAPIPPVQGERYRVKRLYTAGAPQRNDPPTGDEKEGVWETISDSVVASNAHVPSWYNPRTRCVEVETMTAQLERLLHLPFNDPRARFDATVGSAALALQLNDKSYHLEIPSPLGSIPAGNQPVRQLWIRRSLTSLNPLNPLNRPLPPPRGRPRPVISPNPISSPQLLVQSTPPIPSIPMLPAPRIEIPLPPPPPPNPPPFIAPRDRYNLTLHPSTRTAAALPAFNSTINPGRAVYSSHDYIPTRSTTTVDLIFSLHRNRAGMLNSSGMLSITVIIPIATLALGIRAEEELLVHTYNGTGASMLYNKRLVPTLAAAPGQLHVVLTARNAPPGGERRLNNAQTEDASFVLRGCEIADVKTLKDVEVLGEGLVKRGVAKIGIVFKTRPPGLVAARTERYFVDVVKKEVER